MTGDHAERHGRRGGLLMLLAVAAAVAGVVLVIVAVVSQEPDAPRLDGPVGTLDGDTGETGSSDSSGPPPSTRPPDVSPAATVPLGPSEPVSISIPAIDVSSAVFAIGKNPDGTLAVPQPGPNLDKAAWFENSPTPGQPGPSVIEGHVATDESGPSIFYDLADLRPGDEISVQREDGRTVVFTVDALREFDKDAFPTELVYGGDLGTPTLRLITCSSFDPSVGKHTGNLVVFAHLTDVTRG